MLGWHTRLAWHRTFYPSDAVPADRFYGSVSPGPNSHLYVADRVESQSLKDLQYVQPSDQPRWNFEESAFTIDLPVAGVCTASAPVKVYRAYNNRALQGDSNHRLTTDLVEYNKQIAAGWLGEGVVMCALPQPQ